MAWCPQCWRESAMQSDCGLPVERAGWWPVKCYAAINNVDCLLVELRSRSAWIAVLASNLAVAGGLCEAFDQGYEQREHEHLYSNHGYRTDQDWRPGCNQPHRSGR
jgi:hypothetical protein